MLGSLTSVESVITTLEKHAKRVVAIVYTRLLGRVTPG